MTESPNPQRRQRLAAILALAPVVPVVTLERAEHAVPLARALAAGGLRSIEITLRTQAAWEGAERILAEAPEAVVGIGTVLSPGDLERAERLGAHFALSPGATPDLVAAAAASPLPFVPGITTPSELMAAQAAGLDIVKFFPAMAAGGPAALKALAGPFPGARFCPTGGIDGSNAAEWLKLSNVLAVGGSWVCPTRAIREGAWDEITGLARAAAGLRGV